MNKNNQRQPNVILVMTDDQGYGDLGCTGNPWIQTPHIDRFYGEALRLTDFHVSPLCTPTRGALLTGRHPLRNGAWATCWGRSILRAEEMTLADIFAANGYGTALFGKWHLGDNYPYRPMDRGFQHVVAHKGGGVGQTPDFWGNNYFDDTYFHNGEPVPHEGYCTDIWFDEALSFIEANRDRPFFVYLSTNAPHSPYLVAERYRRMYEGNPDIPQPAFCGMITNIDENFGRLEQKLQEWNLVDDTILIFMTDNGSSAGAVWDKDGHVVSGYNAGMRGKKASYYDGGHRVPFFIRWPAGGLGGGRDLSDLSMHVDLLPTLVDLCGLRSSKPLKSDGTSLAARWRGHAPSPNDRVQFLQFRQHTAPPEKWSNAVLTSRWRLVRGGELYDIQADPAQRQDVAEQYPEVVGQLRTAHEKWWAEASQGLEDYCPISLGAAAENPTRLDALDVMGDVAWNQNQVVLAKKSTGSWCVNVEHAGTYTFALRRWPQELDLTIDDTVPPEDARGHTYADDSGRCEVLAPVAARLGLFGKEWRQPCQSGRKEIRFLVELPQTGVTRLDAWFVDGQGEECGAYYVYVKREDLDPSE